MWFVHRVRFLGWMMSNKQWFAASSDTFSFFHMRQEVMQLTLILHVLDIFITTALTPSVVPKDALASSPCGSFIHFSCVFFCLWLSDAHTHTVALHQLLKKRSCYHFAVTLQWAPCPFIRVWMLQTVTVMMRTLRLNHTVNGPQNEEIKPDEQHITLRKARRTALCDEISLLCTL